MRDLHKRTLLNAAFACVRGAQLRAGLDAAELGMLDSTRRCAATRCAPPGLGRGRRSVQRGAVAAQLAQHERHDVGADVRVAHVERVGEAHDRVDHEQLERLQAVSRRHDERQAHKDEVEERMRVRGRARRPRRRPLGLRAHRHDNWQRRAVAQNELYERVQCERDAEDRRDCRAQAPRVLKHAPAGLRRLGCGLRSERLACVARARAVRGHECVHERGESLVERRRGVRGCGGGGGWRGAGVCRRGRAVTAARLHVAVAVALGREQRALGGGGRRGGSALGRRFCSVMRGRSQAQGRGVAGQELAGARDGAGERCRVAVEVALARGGREEGAHRHAVLLVAGGALAGVAHKDAAHHAVQELLHAGRL